MLVGGIKLYPKAHENRTEKSQGHYFLCLRFQGVCSPFFSFVPLVTALPQIGYP
jgi:hypothetical protein